MQKAKFAAIVCPRIYWFSFFALLVFRLKLALLRKSRKNPWLLTTGKAQFAESELFSGLQEWFSHCNLLDVIPGLKSRSYRETLAFALIHQIIVHNIPTNIDQINIYVFLMNKLCTRLAS